MAISVVNWLFPAACTVCGKLSDGGMCPSCSECLYPIENACPGCALPMYQHGDLSCQHCSTRSAVQRAFQQASCRYHYGEHIQTAILRSKQKSLDSCRQLAELLRLWLWAKASDCDIVVPVPSDRGTLFRRGYNHIERIYRYTRCPVPLRPMLARRMFCRKQVGLTRKQRLANNRLGFYVSSRRDLEGKRVLLFDDVITTTRTASVCARLLKNAGASEVLVAAIARVE